ncbi:proser2 [Pungitius sinensis]
MTSDPRTMDARLQGLPKLHHRVNGGSGPSSRPREDDPLHFLSREEQECLKFFEKTIDSLDESLEPVDMNPSLSAARLGPKDQDIIYLVRPEPDLVQNKALAFNPNRPDFQSMMQNPESHVEMRPRREALDGGLPSEYNPPLPSGSYGATDHHSSYHPPGSIPTPVLIAQQIADNKAGGASNLHPSSFLRSHNQDHDAPQSPAGDPQARYAPPTSAKAPHFPTNISVTPHGHNQSQPLGNVKLQERRLQMLANLSGTPSTLLQEDPQPAPDAPAHSISFKDPSADQSRMEALTRNRAMLGTPSTPLQEDPRPAPEPAAQNAAAHSISFMDPSPDQSRMEALSKLGLNRDRATSGGRKPSLDAPDAAPQSPPPDKATGGKPAEAGAPRMPDLKVPKGEVAMPQPSLVPAERKPEIERSDSLRRFDERNKLLSALSVAPSNAYLPPPLDDMASFPPPPEVASHGLNSYGGKSINVIPSVSTRREAAAPPRHEPKVLPTGLANPSEFNPYGGKTKVMNPAPPAGARSNLPDLIAPHVDRSQTLPARSEPPPTELNSYGGKSRTFNPAAGLNRPPDGPARSFRAPAPAPAPKPGRHSYHAGAGAPQRAAPRALSPEHRRKSASTFRPQGITVQFSGRGATDESRREALRKLGLLKES